MPINSYIIILYILYYYNKEIYIHIKDYKIYTQDYYVNRMHICLMKYNVAIVTVSALESMTNNDYVINQYITFQSTISNVA